MPDKGRGHGGPHKPGAAGRIKPGPQAGRDLDRARQRRGGSGASHASPAPATGRSRSKGTSSRTTVHLEDEILRELRATARPGKGDILIKVFADAATAFAAGDIEQAIELGEQSKHIALRAPSIRELLGLAYYRAGRWQEATRELAAFRRITGTTEQNPVIADSYRALGKPEKAVELVDEMQPSSVSVAVYYEGQIVAAGALTDMKKLDDAIARLESLELRPPVVEEHHIRVWYVLGDLLERKGRFTQARDWFEAISSTDAELTDAPERLKRLGTG